MNTKYPGHSNSFFVEGLVSSPGKIKQEESGLCRFYLRCVREFEELPNGDVVPGRSDTFLMRIDEVTPELAYSVKKLIKQSHTATVRAVGAMRSSLGEEDYLEVQHMEVLSKGGKNG